MLPLAALSLSAFMLLVDVTIVNVALPTIRRDLDASFSELQWFINAYALTLAALLLSAGSLADRLGRRRVHLAGICIFASASLGCGFAPDPLILIGLRALQGLGGAAMHATTLALLSQTYAGRQRSIAFGVWGAVNGAAAASGPLLGGILTSQLGWHWIFFVNVPVGLLAFICIAATVGESRNPDARRLDLPGLITFSVAIAALVLAIINSAEHIAGAATLGWGALSVLALVAFVAIERRQAEPMFDLALLRSAPFVGVSVAAVTLSSGIFALYLPLTLWLQSALGLSPLQAGLAVLPNNLAGLLTSLLAGRFLAFVDQRARLAWGLALIAVGIALMHLLVGPAATVWAVVPGLVVSGVGVGLTSPAIAATAMRVVPAARAGLAAGATTTFRQLGMALGIAALGALFAAGVGGGHGTRADLASAMDGVMLLAAGTTFVGGLLATVLLRTRAPRSGVRSAGPPAGRSPE